MCGTGPQELVQVDLGHQHAVGPSGPGLMPHTPRSLCGPSQFTAKSFCHSQVK